MSRTRTDPWPHPAPHPVPIAETEKGFLLAPLNGSYALTALEAMALGNDLRRRAALRMIRGWG